MVQPSRPKRGHLFKSCTDGSGSAKVTPERRNPIGSRVTTEAVEGILHLEGEERTKGNKRRSMDTKRGKLTFAWHHKETDGASFRIAGAG